MLPRIAGRFDYYNVMADSAKSSVVKDVEGNDYIDFVLGNLTQIHGHRSVELKKVLSDTLDRYSNVGDCMHGSIRPLSDLILKISSKDDIRYTNSGSEALHLAVRLARAATGKKKVLKFVGHYHGWFNEEINTFLSVKVSAGVPEEYTANTFNVSWNNKNEVLEAFDRCGDEIAAVICEPILGHSGVIPPFDGFLEFLREISSQNACCLIFDECITGFRVALGGAQEHCGVKADIVTYSKALSGGIPFGVVAGTNKYMELARKWEVYHGSTFDSNPVSVNAALYTINKMINTKTHEKIAHNTSALIEGISDIMKKERQHVLFQSVPGMFQFFFTDQARVVDYDGAMKTDWKKTKKIIEGMRAKNILLSSGELHFEDTQRNWMPSFFVSTAHDENIHSRFFDSLRNIIRSIG